MQKPSKNTLLMIGAALITIVGLVTGWYFFILLIFPLSLDFFRKKGDDQD